MIYLEYYPLQGSSRTIPLNVVPFRFGRSSGAHLVIPSSQVSKEHAEIFQVDNEFRIRDLGSTNGTYVNGERVLEARLGHDNIIHIADEEFRFVAMSATEPDAENPLTQPLKGKISGSFVRGTRFMDELLSQRIVRILFQPILKLSTKETVGFEALGRGNHEQLSSKPYELLQLAERCGKVTRLSELFREVAIEECPKLPTGPLLFLNIHPSEIHEPKFLSHMAEIQSLIPTNRQMVLEIHEDVACDFPTMKELRQRLRELDIMVAYDDFGAGQARFLELAELPPDFVKLDMKLIRDIDQATPRHNLIRALARVSQELGIRVLAEGVETAQEAKVCLELGCEYGQGYFYGLPRMASAQSSEVRTNIVNVAELRSRLREMPA